MGHGGWARASNAQCPMPMANASIGGAAIPLHPQGDGVSRRFQ
ncbi:MAG: hypothetical protein V7K98_26255 [Nostoc sp.]